MDWTAIGFFLLLIILEALAIYATKHYSVHHDNMYLILSVLFYSFVPILLYLIISHDNYVSIINTSWNVVSTIYGVLIGVLLFNEKVNPYQWIGIVLALLSFFFLFKG